MGAGTVAALVLVIAFGNQWLWEEILKKDDPGDNSGWHILQWLNTPHWVIDKSGFFEELPGKNVAGGLVGVLALLVVVAFVIGTAVRRAYANAFLAGWFSLVAGGAAYNLVAYLITGSLAVSAYSEDRSLAGVLAVLGLGAGYGFLAGWAVGIVCALAASPAPGTGHFGGQFSYSPPPPPPVNPPPGGYRY